MRIPVPKEKLSVQYDNKVIRAIVRSVGRRRERRDLYEVELMVSGDSFSKGQECYWLDERGNQIQRAAIQRVSVAQNVEKPFSIIVLLAKAGEADPGLTAEQT